MESIWLILLYCKNIDILTLKGFAGFMKKKVISYTRMSSKKQLQGRSKDRQEEIVEKWLVDNDGELLTQYQDLGVSGFRGKNVEKGELGILIRDLESGKIEKGTYLVIESLDRFGRDEVRKQQALFLNLLNGGLNIVIVSNSETNTFYHTGHKLADPTKDMIDMLVAMLVMVRAREESEAKSNRIKDAWKTKHESAALTKTAYTTVCPMWMEKDGDSFKLIPERVEVITEIINMYVGGKGDFAIARTLNEEGVKRFTSVNHLKTLETRPHWINANITEIRRNEALYGVYNPKRKIKGVTVYDDPIEGFYPAVITKDRFLELQAESAKRVAVKTGGKSQLDNVFKSVAKCGSCGCNLHYMDKGQSRGKSYIYLRCGCNKVSVDYRDALNIALPSLYRINKDKILAANEERAGKSELRITTLEASLHEDKEKVKPLVDFVTDNPSNAIFAKIVELEKSIKSKEKDLEKLRIDLTTIDIDEDTTLDYSTEENRRKMNNYLRAVVQTMTVHKPDKNTMVYELELNLERGKSWVYCHRKSLHKHWRVLPIHEDSIYQFAATQGKQRMYFPESIEDMQEFAKLFVSNKMIKGNSEAAERLRGYIARFNSDDLNKHGYIDVAYR